MHNPAHHPNFQDGVDGTYKARDVVHEFLPAAT